jgi:hypothetical protein
MGKETNGKAARKLQLKEQETLIEDQAKLIADLTASVAPQNK